MTANNLRDALSRQIEYPNLISVIDALLALDVQVTFHVLEPQYAVLGEFQVSLWRASHLPGGKVQTQTYGPSISACLLDVAGRFLEADDPRELGYVRVDINGIPHVL